MEHYSCLGFAALSPLAVSLATGCGGSDSGAASAVLDPTQSHYGRTDTDWSVSWWQWIYGLTEPMDPTQCIIPFLDATGANCTYGQSGDVFFLAGTGTGTVVRKQCIVPAGKAIFFPI